jgi:hypothetical protein
MPADNVGKWEIKTFDGRKLHAVSASSVDQVLINWLIEDYKKAPKDSAYSELTLSRVLRDEEGGRRRYFIFNLEYVDDVNVVYVLDSRNIVLEKFLASPWVR